MADKAPVSSMAVCFTPLGDNLNEMAALVQISVLSQIFCFDMRSFLQMCDSKPQSGCFESLRAQRLRRFYAGVR
jgi:hypothetical protein